MGEDGHAGGRRHPCAARTFPRLDPARTSNSSRPAWSRDPPDAERAVLNKIRAELESERTMFKAGLEPGGTAGRGGAQLLHPQADHRSRTPATWQDPDALMVRAFQASGLHLFPHGRRQGKPRLADPRRRHRLGSGRHRFTLTCRRASSAPRSSASPTSSRPAARRRPSAPANSAWR